MINFNMMMNNNIMGNNNMMNNNMMMNNPMMINNNININMNNNINNNNFNNNLNNMMNMNNNMMNMNNNIMNMNMNLGMNNMMNMNNNIMNMNINLGMNNMNNFMGLPLMNLMLFLFNPANIFMNNEEGNKYLYRKIIKLDDKYFIVASTLHQRINNNITHYCYLSLFDFNSMEETTKIEICKIIENNILKFEFNMIMNNNNIRINIVSSRNYLYNLKFIENELKLEENI